MSVLAMWAGVHRRQVSRWQEIGVPVWVADRVAVALGEHPSALWPEYFAGAVS